MATPFVPPGGFAGFAQQTPAVQAMLAKTPRKKARKKKKPATGARSAPKKKATPRKSTAKKGGRLKKGSPEAKRRMAQIRKLRK